VTEAEAKAEGKSASERALLYVMGGAIALLAVLLVGVLAWRALSIRGLHGQMEAQRSELEEGRRRELATQAGAMLRLAALPLGWAVRAEMIKENFDQIDDYFRLFVKEPGVERLLLVGKDGQIRVATDKKLEGQAAAPLVSAPILEAVEVVLEESAHSTRVAVPIMALDSRVGVMVLDYSRRAPASPPPLSPGATSR